MISIYGNCQSKEIANMLGTSKNFTQRYGTASYQAFNYVFEKTHRPVDEIIQNFRKTDILIYQPLSDKHFPYSTNHLIKYLPAHCTLVSFPYIFNDAIWGYPVEGNYKDAINGDFDLPEGYMDILDRFNRNIALTREKESETAIKLSDFIQENFKEVELFYTQNHPTPVIIKEVCRQIMEYLGIENDLATLDVNIYSTYYGDFRWPILQAAVDAFDFKYQVKYQII